MTRLLSKIMLALLMLPLGCVVYVLAIVISIEVVFGYSGEYAPWIVATLATWAFVGSYWTLLWYGTVRWTRHRMTLTAAAMVVAAAAGCAGGWLASMTDRSFGAFLGGIIAIVFWLTATVFIWRETAAEHRERIEAGGSVLVCPACGYNLTGLRQTTCPECGASYTVNELVAMQPQRQNTEL